MSAAKRRESINRNYEGRATTAEQVDAALYGQLARVDADRRNATRNQFGAFRLTGCGLEIGSDPRESDWRELGEFIFSLEGAIQWIIGDWLACGENHKWGDTAAIAASLGRETKTLYEYTYVARSVRFSIRMENLKFGHHQLVAAMNEDDQRAALTHASEHKLSIADFRKWLRGIAGDPPPPLPAVAVLDEKQFFKIFRKSRKLWAKSQKNAKEWAELEGYLAMLRRTLDAMQSQQGRGE